MPITAALPRNSATFTTFVKEQWKLASLWFCPFFLQTFQENPGRRLSEGTKQTARVPVTSRCDWSISIAKLARSHAHFCITLLKCNAETLHLAPAENPYFWMCSKRGREESIRLHRKLRKITNKWKSLCPRKPLPTRSHGYKQGNNQHNRSLVSSLLIFLVKLQLCKAESRGVRKGDVETPWPGPVAERKKRWNVTGQREESCAVEMGGEEQREAASYSRGWDGKFLEVPKRRREGKIARVVCGACRLLSPQN